MATEKDKREAERFPVNGNSQCILAAPVVEDFGPVKIKNLSTSGIGLITSKNLEPGVLLAVKLSNSLKNVTKALLVRVIHVTPQPGGIYLIGGSLDSPLTYEELCLFVL